METNLTSLDLSSNTALLSLRITNDEIADLQWGLRARFRIDPPGPTAEELSQVLPYLLIGDTLSEAELQQLKKEFAEAQAAYDAYESFSSLDLSNCTALQSFECHGAKISELDLSHNTALQSLSLSFTGISSLDLKNNTALQSLSILNLDNLVSLNLADCSSLLDAEISSNISLSSLDFSGCSSLLDLTVSDMNALTSLTLNCPSLVELDIIHNMGLTSFNLGHCPSLQNLNVTQNFYLISLDASSCPELRTLSCVNSSLVSLDVSKYTKLHSLNCTYNSSLESLTLNPGLEKLTCYENALATLSVPDGCLYDSDSSCIQSVRARPYQQDTQWKLNLSGIVGPENLDKITITSDNAQLSNGIVLFKSEEKPATLSYLYNAGLVRKSDVITGYDTDGAPIYGTEDIPLKVTVYLAYPESIPDSMLATAPAHGNTPGTRLSDFRTAASYTIDPSGKGVIFTGTANRKASSIRVPDTVTLSGVTYKVTGISDNAFTDHKNLKSVAIGKNVTSIGANAFAKCKKLTKITLPAKIKKIGKAAFSGCSKLKTITIKSTKLTSKNVGAKAFKGISSKATVKVPKSKKKAYAKLLKAKGAGKKVRIK